MESWMHSSTVTLSLCIWTLFVSLSVFECKGNKLSLTFSLQKSIWGPTFWFPMWLCISFLSTDVEQFKASIFLVLRGISSRILGGLLLLSVWFSEYPFRFKLGVGFFFVGFPALKWFEQTLVSLVILKSFLLMSCDQLLYKLGRGHRWKCTFCNSPLYMYLKKSYR